MVQSKVSIQLKKKKKTPESSLLPPSSNVLGSENADTDDVTPTIDEDRPPLIIPVRENTHQRFSSNNAADEAAARALEQQQGEISVTNKSTSFTIPNPSDSTFQRKTATDDTTIYRTELAQLPAHLDETDDAYERIPIADFGAAMLRGMGWNDETTTASSTTEQQDSTTALPRPHRLGLGAVPKQDNDANTTSRNRPRRMDEYRRDQQRTAQVQQYHNQFQAQLQEDPQRTLQVNSIVYIFQDSNDEHRRRRARIVQLRGVPGLNRIRVVMEGDAASQDVPRRWAHDLVPRSALLERPFREVLEESGNNGDDDKPVRVESTSTSNAAMERSQVEEEKDTERKRSERKKKRKHRDNEDRTSKQKKRLFTWIVPHIRVRIVSERYGQSYFRQKAIVVDVTPQGATLQLLHGVVLDHVQERHLVTALPSVGGHCVVVGTSPHKGTIGRLLERDKHTAVLQERENGSVLSLPLDDLAEWCGGENDG